jgi:hypothetical protein
MPLARSEERRFGVLANNALRSIFGRMIEDVSRKEAVTK